MHIIFLGVSAKAQQWRHNLEDYKDWTTEKTAEIMADVDKCLYKRLEGTHKVQVGWSVWKLR